MKQNKLDMQQNWGTLSPTPTQPQPAMSSIYKRPGSEIYQCQFYVKDPATGELAKVRKSTGKTNQKNAQAVADELERAAQGVVQSGSDRARQAKAVFAQVVADVERETLTAPAVRKYLAQLLAIATGETLECYTLSAWLDEWLRRKSRSSSLPTMARYRTRSDFSKPCRKYNTAGRNRKSQLLRLLDA